VSDDPSDDQSLAHSRLAALGHGRSRNQLIGDAVPELRESLRQQGIVHDRDLALLVSAGVALVGVVLTVLFLPKTTASIVPVKPSNSTNLLISNEPFDLDD
jgi:hypothetical protein